ncbi:transposase domain-containing protein [Streptomyces phaeochromogenes]|uniref:transposase domain-containing protein n=1 Tax=Streptomyces phaeochromogenes TaxID=1923 RepID=UPI0036968D45
MSSQLSTCTLTRTTTVAAGAFAPGHLGGLTQHVPFELVDHVLDETKTVQVRVPALPSRRARDAGAAPGSHRPGVHRHDCRPM